VRTHLPHPKVAPSTGAAATIFALLPAALLVLMAVEPGAARGSVPRPTTLVHIGLPGSRRAFGVEVRTFLDGGITRRVCVSRHEMDAPVGFEPT